jgi:hypothetical protein
MSIFDDFGLVELKKIFYVIQKEFNMFRNINLYGLNKYDITSLLINSNMFYRDANAIIFKYAGDIKQFTPNPRKCYYRGPKITKTSFREKTTVLDFS